MARNGLAWLGIILLALVMSCSADGVLPDQPEFDRRLPSQKPKIYVAAESALAWSFKVRPIELKLPTRDADGAIIGTIIRYDNGKPFGTTDGRGQAVHPSVACEGDDWNSGKCWIGFNPYPGGDATYENPIVDRFRDSVQVEEMAGAHNPVFAGVFYRQNNSDIDLNWDPAGIWFFSNRFADDSINKVSVMNSPDAVRWRERHTTVEERSHDVVSPSFTVRPDGVPFLYSVRTGRDGCRSSSTSVEVRQGLKVAKPGEFDKVAWGPPQPVSLAQPVYHIWHLEVRYWKRLGLFVGAFPAYPVAHDGIPHSCGESDLFLAVSEDGLNFRTYPVPIIARHNRWEWYTSLYRASLMFDGDWDVMRIWYSEFTLLSGQPDWRIKYTAVKWSEMYDALERLRTTAPRAQMADHAETSVLDRKALKSFRAP